MKRRTLRFGSTGQQVVAAQRLLRRKGVFPYQASGFFGRKTLRAVKQFQKKRKLRVDGVIGPSTWKWLLAPDLPPKTWVGPTPKKPTKPKTGATKASDKIIKFIAEFEGFFPEVYNDPAGHCTIGYGTLLHLGPCTTRDRETWGRISKQRALELLREELEPMVITIVKNSPPLTQYQLDALASFAYNVGVNGYLKSTLRAKLKAGDKQGAADEFTKWVYAGGQKFPGLVRRRKAERDLFLGKNSSYSTRG